MSRVGYNVMAQWPIDPNLLRQTLQRLRGPVVIQDDIRLAHQALEWCPVVIYRQVFVGDAEQWKSDSLHYKTPEQYIAQLRPLNIDPRIYYYVQNEPVPGPRLRELLAWLAEVARLATLTGIRLCLGNFTVGFPEPADIENGNFDELLRQAVNGSHLIGIHEGAPLLLPFGVGRWPKEWLKNPDLVQIWPKREELPQARTPEGWLPGYWLIRRADWLTIRAREIGLSAPLFAVTEFGVDVSGEAELLTQIQSNPPLKGIGTYRDVYARYFKGVPFEEVAYRQLKWANDIYPANYVAICLFTWTDLDTTPEKWVTNGYDFGRLAALRELLINQPLIAPNAPYPEPEPEPEPPQTERVLIANTREGYVLNVRHLTDHSIVIEQIARGSVLTPVDGLDCITARVGKVDEWLDVTTPTGKRGRVAAWLTAVVERIVS